MWNLNSGTITKTVGEISNNFRSRSFPIFFLDARTKALLGGSSNTRGLIFFTFAYIISKHFENDEIFFSENGAQMLDVMLSPLAYPNKPALKNTNPIFINKIEKIFNIFSEEKFTINLMHKNYTKSEMLIKNISTIPYSLSNSCFSTRGKSNMCGICYNCFIRNLSMMSIGIYEQDYEYDPFINILNKSDIYNERQRILYQTIRFYYKVLIKDESALRDIDLSSKGIFENPIELATRFGIDLYLGIKNYFDMYEPSGLNALGNKAKELLYLIDSNLINERYDFLTRTSN
jgi:hypothetical protein